MKDFEAGAVVRAIGLMSGTSMDGIDAALVETDGERIVSLGPTLEVSYTAEERKCLVGAVAAAREMSRRDMRSGALGEAEAMLTNRHAAAVSKLMARSGLDRKQIALIGFHGQTVLHRPDLRLTVQLGDGQALANAVGVPVVCDFRARDVEAGGQGAPLAPVFHRALAESAALPMPLAFVNIGGVANVTWIGADRRLIAFDTGPGNAMLDDWAMRHTGRTMDENGALARAGHVKQAVLETLLRHPYFEQPPPKSLDRNDFSTAALAGLSPEDGAATLSAFTDAAIVLAGRHFPQPPRLWVLCGGGARNPVLVETLKRLTAAPVILADEAGWAVEFIEAQAFGYMAVRSVYGLPLSYPGTTGVPKPMSGGRLYHPQPEQHTRPETMSASG